VARGDLNRWERFKSNFKGAGKAVLFGVTAVTVFSLLTGGFGGPAAMALLPKLVGTASGALFSTYLRNRNEKLGKSTFLAPLLFGTLVGLGTGAAVGTIGELLSGYFASGTPGGEAASTLSTPKTPPPWVPTGDVMRFEDYVVLEPNSKGSVWSILTDQMKDCQI
jgi:hypothetical protein